MVLREWRAEIRRDLRDEYVRHVRKTGLAEYRSTPGNLGASIAVRDLDDVRSEIVTLSFWDDIHSIEAFSGVPVDRARYYPHDDKYLLTKPEHVAHYELAAHLR